MGDLLKQQQRDIVFNLCQYGMGNVWEWGAEVGGHCWRTAGDLGFELDRIFEVALKNAEHRAVVQARRVERPRLHPDRLHRQRPRHGRARALPAHAQRAIRLHVALVPDGRAAVLQRRHGPARRVHAQRALQPRGHRRRPGPAGPVRPRRARSARTPSSWSRTWRTAAKAVGLFNRGEFTRRRSRPSGPIWACRASRPVRDLWRQKDLGLFEGQFKAEVPPRGVVLVRLWPARVITERR